MPHQCTSCGYVFEDGSKEMLSGCPDCRGNTFQFYPEGADVPAAPSNEPPPEPEGGRVGEHVGRATSAVREWMSGNSPAVGAPDDSTTEDATAEDATVEDSTAEDATDGESGSKVEPDDEPATVDDDSEMIADDTSNDSDGEDAAQASARTEFATSDELPAAPSDETTSEPSDETSPAVEPSESPPMGGRVVREPTGERPDLAELREELNDQFESIKIIEPGQYELNLMELYDRDEYIIALQENGRYVIQMPETWINSDE